MGTGENKKGIEQDKDGAQKPFCSYNTDMDNTEELLRELREFEAERAKLRDVLGRIGGQNFARRDTWINIIFLVLILVLFILELTLHIIPTNLSLELGVLLVSVKIVFMIHSQQKVNHFQFWILNSIEFRMNEIGRRVREMEKKLCTAEETEVQDSSL